MAIYGRENGLGTTLREVGLGIKLSLHYSKARILEMYLNAVYYGHGHWSEVAAARGYSNTTPNKLDWAQEAMLAGIIHAPSAYDSRTARPELRRRFGGPLVDVERNMPIGWVLKSG